MLFVMGQPPTYTPNLIWISARKCRGPKSSNRIELSWSFKFYCIFSDLSHSSSCGSVDGWEWMWVCLGVPLTCPHIHAHAHRHTHMHNTKIHMYSNCKWPPPWRHPCSSCLTCMCICACMSACMGHSNTPTPHPPTHPPTPKRVTPQIS